MIERYRGIWARRAVLDTLVRRDLRVRYARSALGYLWTIIDPLAMALIYFVVFAVIFQRPRRRSQAVLPLPSHRPAALAVVQRVDQRERARPRVGGAAGAVDEPAT